MTQKYSEEVFGTSATTSYLSKDFWTYIELLLKPFIDLPGGFQGKNVAFV